ncbi:glycosyltransferase [Paeniglutamicibacter antarcticus]|uniref:D-inositol 3-phosphate glycosyltransferase n=1 Tax=Arthrobacter terrae TaxID=2935737 RepID=A0A931CNB6_9MICC|nr:glycosyltransferase [Arthrobacter terrae]MBG0738009.1 glycosyltransferase [Arthrobacter terrae]
MRVQNCLDALKKADRLVDALRLADDLAVEASRNGGVRNIRILRSAIGSKDQIVAIAATHALAQMVDEEADIVLSELLSSEHGFIREHAAWAHRSRVPRAESIGRLIGLVASGGFAAMLSQRTLEVWATSALELVTIGLESALLGVTEPESRYRLVETLGLVQHSIATTALLRIAQDESEDLSVRIAAIAALGQRKGQPKIVEFLEKLVETGGRLAEVAQLSLVDLAVQDISENLEAMPQQEAGLTVAQLFLHADIDADLSQSGSGDNGGIATLLVRLGDALVAGQDRDPDAFPVGTDRCLPIDRVLTLSRGGADEAAQSVAVLGETQYGHVYGRIPLLQDPRQSANAWRFLVAARRGISRILRAAGGVQVIHLRMADVGSLAAFDVARALDIPVVFTVAPDPHSVINSMDHAGTLNRENFGDIDEVEHFWFRARLVQRLASNSAHTVFFPRPNLRHDIIELVGIDIAKEPKRHTIVPEGIDLAVIDRAVLEAQSFASGQPASAGLLELRDLLSGLPVERRGLPLLTSVGRFHRVKGMATIVEAWAGSDLRHRTNLLLIGGNLQNPSADEREQLDRIAAIVGPHEQLRSGLVLSGHRPNDTVARWVAATSTGLPGYAAPRGVYVCGSLKEEFGIALLEAMASGLVVVGPDTGGPATYVEQGRTGFLTTTWDTALLRDAVHAALLCAAGETTDNRTVYARNVVQERFTIEAMAHTLTQVYADVHHDDVELRRELILSP